MTRNWTNNEDNSKRKDFNFKGRNNKFQYQSRINLLKNWLQKLPKIESHYRRKYTKKYYFESEFSTYKQIFNLYVLECKANENNEITPVSFPHFMAKKIG